jgi:hypothetical protein
MLFDNNWKQLNDSNHSIQQEGLAAIKSLTYDSLHEVFYFANNNKNPGIYRLKVHNETSFEINKLVEGSSNENIRDIVYDSHDDALYWSDSEQQKIFKFKLKTNSKEVFLNASSGVEGLEIDSCKRNLFFVRKFNEKLNVVSLDSNQDRKATEVGVGNHIKPLAVAIDHQNRRLYVADKHPSNSYSIDSILTNGSDFRREIDSHQKTPRSIAVDSEYVYYVEGSDHELRRYKKNYDLNVKQTSDTFLRSKLKGDPQDIIVKSNFITDLKSELCKASQTMNEAVTMKTVRTITQATTTQATTEAPKKEETNCACKENNFCEINRCNNFCLNDGKCSIVKGEPKCFCNMKFAGDRCEVNVCTNYCLNDGECTVNRNTKQPLCKCDGNFSGKRCEKSRADAKVETTSEAKVPESTVDREISTLADLPQNLIQNAEKHIAPTMECSQLNVTYIIIAVCATISLFIFLVILVIAKKMKRPIRPRIKKTFKVRKNIEPLTYRPHTEQCEVIIEDCCNMNICETVCFLFNFPSTFLLTVFVFPLALLRSKNPSERNQRKQPQR